jgi:hypothetical protein
MIWLLCVFITAVPNTNMCAWGEEDSGGHVQLDTKDDTAALDAGRRLAATITALGNGDHSTWLSRHRAMT